MIHCFPLQKLSGKTCGRAGGSFYYQLKFGCLWAVFSDNELSVYKYTNEQNVAVSKKMQAGNGKQYPKKQRINSQWASATKQIDNK